MPITPELRRVFSTPLPDTDGWINQADILSALGWDRDTFAGAQSLSFPAGRARIIPDGLSFRTVHVYSKADILVWLERVDRCRGSR
jgi:hypothetical protein